MPEKNFPESPDSAVFGPNSALEALRRRTQGLYLGHDRNGWCFAAPEQSVMVLGPPRAGKTTSIVVPNVLAATGAVVSTSTKPDVLDATVGVRSEVGTCRLFDPIGSIGGRIGLPEVRWSPLQACGTWLGSLSAARNLVRTVGGGGAEGFARADHPHWTERAESLLAPLLHAAALGGGDMRTVLTWVDRRLALTAQQILAMQPGRGAELARNLLDGIVATDPRELSGIWSTASGSLGGFRSERALESTREPSFDPEAFVDSADTVYVAVPAHLQALVAPMVVGLIEDVRRAAYARAAAGRRDPGRTVVLALDELANIAPLPDLPGIVSEGGGQGLVTLGCFQDLSQARRRWPGHADGFSSLFGTTIVLPGIGDVRTLDSLSRLAGDIEVPTRSVTAGRTVGDRPVIDLLTGGRPHVSAGVSSHWRRRLPVHAIAQGTPGHAVAFDERNRPSWVPLAPSHRCEPWRSLRGRELGNVIEPAGDRVRAEARGAEPTAPERQVSQARRDLSASSPTRDRGPGSDGGRQR